MGGMHCYALTHNLDIRMKEVQAIPVNCITSVQINFTQLPSICSYQYNFTIEQYKKKRGKMEGIIFRVPMRLTSLMRLSGVQLSDKVSIHQVCLRIYS